MKKINKSALIISILIPLLVGALSALLSGNMDIYTNLNKPPLSPPSFIFPIVWTILYVLMGISSYIIYRSPDPYKDTALKVYGVQLFFNFVWPLIFFGLQNFLLSFIWLIALILLIMLMISKFYKINPLSAYLQIPYLIWSIFATYLNFMVYLLN